MVKKKVKEDWLFEWSNPKIKQQIKLLLGREDFLNEVNLLRKKWKPLISKRDDLQRIFDKENKKLLKKYKTYFPSSLSKEEKGRIFTPLHKQFEILEDDEFNKDIIRLCKRYKIYPIGIWRHTLLFFIVEKSLIPPYLGFGNGIFYGDGSLDIHKQKPYDLNFAIEIRENKETKELELFIQIFDNTSLGDVKKYWKVIELYRDRLKAMKGIKKRYYPLKNLSVAQKLAELDKIEKSDWVKQEKIYGEIGDLDFGKKEKKRKNKIKQIRYQYKKRLKS